MLASSLNSAIELATTTDDAPNAHSRKGKRGWESEPLAIPCVTYNVDLILAGETTRDALSPQRATNGIVFEQFREAVAVCPLAVDNLRSP